MTAKTSRYGLEYAEPTDLVANLPQLLKAQADSVDAALGDVDDRHTQNTYVPVKANSLALLNQTTPIDGQNGLIIDSTTPGEDGLYLGVSGTWLKIRDFAAAHANDIAVTKFVLPFAKSPALLIRAGNLVTASGMVDAWRKSGWRDYQDDLSETLPEGYRPILTDVPFSIGIISAGRADDQLVFQLFHNGKFAMRGSADTLRHTSVTGTWTTSDPWPTAGEA